MSEPLKNHYSRRLINKLADAITTQYPAFDNTAFIHCIYTSSWNHLSLKQRVRQISHCLHQFLPTPYKQAIKILLPVAELFNTFEDLFFQDYVECYGLDDFATSMLALACFTHYATAEFAIRAFIRKYENRTLKQMQQWAESTDPHLRRLASEGCRPRLPWASHLNRFKKNPQPVFEILEKLMLDDSAYVRRSVANNLNDISRDHPEQLLDWCAAWQGRHPHADWIIKHACRSLLKQGQPRALALFGYRQPTDIKITSLRVKKSVALNEQLTFSFQLHTTQYPLGKLRIEYALDFMKANGRQARKIFMLSDTRFNSTEKSFRRYYSFKPRTTRRFYPGKHRLTIIVNGVSLIHRDFLLVP